VIACTAKLKPALAMGSVSYNLVRYDSAVASVPRTCTAVDRRWFKEGQESRMSEGVIDMTSSKGGDISRSHGVAGEGGDGGGTEGACDEFMR
jgi:hypothetical protein